MYNMEDHLFILDDNNKVVKAANVIEWGEFIGSQRKIVAQDKIDNIFISTVFLGLVHRGGIFESMIFNDNGIDDFMTRYETYEEAVEGHNILVNQYKNRPEK